MIENLVIGENFLTTAFGRRDTRHDGDFTTTPACYEIRIRFPSDSVDIDVPRAACRYSQHIGTALFCEAVSNCQQPLLKNA